MNYIYVIIYLELKRLFRKEINNMTTRGMIVKWSDDEIEFGEWTQENNLETFVAETELGTLRVPIDPSTEYYDDETGRTYLKQLGKNIKQSYCFRY